MSNDIHARFKTNLGDFDLDVDLTIPGRYLWPLRLRQNYAATLHRRSAEC